MRSASVFGVRDTSRRPMLDDAFAVEHERDREQQREQRGRRRRRRSCPPRSAIGVEFTSRRLGKSSSHCRTFFDALASRSRGPMIGSVAELVDGLRDVLVEVADLVDRRHGDEHDRGDRDHARSPTSTIAAAYRRCQPVRRRSASTTGSARTRAATRSR